MLKTVETWTNIIGAALILGLLLRYGNAASQLIKTSSHAFVDIFSVVSLQGGTPQRSSTAQSESTQG